MTLPNFNLTISHVSKNMEQYELSHTVGDVCKVMQPL